MMQQQEATAVAAAQHITLEVRVSVAIDRRAYKSLCTLAKELTYAELTGSTPLPTPEQGSAACQRCQHILVTLGASLQGLVPLRDDVVAAQERAFAQRRLQWKLESFRDQAATLAANYLRMAKAVEERLAQFNRTYDDPTVPAAAKQGLGLRFAIEMVHTQAWGVANTNVDTLLNYAAELDQTAREAQ